MLHEVGNKYSYLLNQQETTFILCTCTKTPYACCFIPMCSCKRLWGRAFCWMIGLYWICSYMHVMGIHAALWNFYMQASSYTTVLDLKFCRIPPAMHKFCDLREQYRNCCGTIMSTSGMCGSLFWYPPIMHGSCTPPLTSNRGDLY